MTIHVHGLSSLRVALGFLILLGLPAQTLAKGPKISVGDDPSMKEGTPDLVLVEVADFQ